MGYEYVVKGIPRLDCIVTVVDALRMQSEFGCGDNLRKKDLEEDDIENLLIQQIEFCDKILLNKASEVTPEELGRMESIIRALQPKAEIIRCDYADVDLDKIIHTGSFDYENVATSATWIQKVEEGAPAPDEDDDEDEHHHHEDEHHHHEDEHHDEDEDHHHEEEHHHHHHHHHDDEGEAEEYGISTWVYYSRAPFDINKFDFFIDKRWPSQVIRAKGMCWFQDEPDVCYLFEQAGRQFSLKNIGQWFATMPEDELRRQLEVDVTLQRDWDEKYGDRMQKIVFIGQHLDKDSLRKALDACQVSF
jgi:G3E family GTPase